MKLVRNNGLELELTTEQVDLLNKVLTHEFKSEIGKRGNWRSHAKFFHEKPELEDLYNSYADKADLKARYIRELRDFVRKG